MPDGVDQCLSEYRKWDCCDIAAITEQYPFSKLYSLSHAFSRGVLHEAVNDIACRCDIAATSQHAPNMRYGCDIGAVPFQ